MDSYQDGVSRLEGFPIQLTPEMEAPDVQASESQPKRRQDASSLNEGNCLRTAVPSYRDGSEADTEQYSPLLIRAEPVPIRAHDGILISFIQTIVGVPMFLRFSEIPEN